LRLPFAEDPPAVVATLPVTVASRVQVEEFITRWTNAEYKALQLKRTSDNGHTAKVWDSVCSSGYIDMNRNKVKNLKSDLVTDGVLTQARADEIFS
jgi:hypothetical protein